MNISKKLIPIMLSFTVAVAVIAIDAHVDYPERSKITNGLQSINSDDVSFILNNIESTGVGPGDSVNISAKITSQSKVDFWAFVNVEMPVYNDAGLYNLKVNDEWTLLYSGLVDDSWVEAYCYSTPLKKGDTTTDLVSSLTMVNMGLADFIELTDIDISVMGHFHCANNITMDQAWSVVAWEIVG